VIRFVRLQFEGEGSRLLQWRNGSEARSLVVRPKYRLRTLTGPASRIVPRDSIADDYRPRCPASISGEGREGGGETDPAFTRRAIGDRRCQTRSRHVAASVASGAADRKQARSRALSLLPIIREGRSRRNWMLVDTGCVSSGGQATECLDSLKVTRRAGR